jgi:hypothetical protein
MRLVGQEQDMRDFSETAATRWQGAVLAALVMALGLSAQAPGSAAAAAGGADPIITGSVTPPAPAVADHELRIEFTREGAEGLELAARLDARGGLVTRPVRWTVKRALAGSPAVGEPVFVGESPVADLRLQPGEYRVEASYGLARIVHEVAIHPRQWVGVTLILHVGGVRALSLVEDQELPPGIDAAHRIYALSGRHSGQRLTATGQGELARLEAGNYRVESRFEPGNAVTETTVEVKPGILSSLHIAHLAGLVRVEYPGGGDAGFEVRDLDSGWVWRGHGPRGDLVLAPGRYEARALGGEPRVVGFEVAQGDSIVVLLDP